MHMMLIAIAISMLSVQLAAVPGQPLSVQGFMRLPLYRIAESLTKLKRLIGVPH